MLPSSAPWDEDCSAPSKPPSAACSADLSLGQPIAGGAGRDTEAGYCGHAAPEICLALERSFIGGTLTAHCHNTGALKDHAQMGGRAVPDRAGSGGFWNALSHVLPPPGLASDDIGHRLAAAARAVGAVGRLVLLRQDRGPGNPAADARARPRRHRGGSAGGCRARHRRTVPARRRDMAVARGDGGCSTTPCRLRCSSGARSTFPSGSPGFSRPPAPCSASWWRMC